MSNDPVARRLSLTPEPCHARNVVARPIAVGAPSGGYYAYRALIAQNDLGTSVHIIADAINEWSDWRAARPTDVDA